MALSRYLDYDVIQRIDSMQLLARGVVEGFLLGLHRSPYRGFSVEFAEYRTYSPGDEIRHIDWKVYGKTDRYYIKQFEEETNLACTLLLDRSASMGYSSAPEGPTKLQYACYLAACLSYFMLRQRDAAGLVTFDIALGEMLPPRLGQAHLRHLMAILDRCEPGGQTQVAKPLHELAEGLRRRGMVILISDLLDDVEAILSALQHFRYQGHDVLVLHVMDPAELSFPFDATTEFADLETGERATVAPEGLRPLYMKKLGAFLDAIEKGCADIRADYRLFDTSQPLELALSEYLFRRGKLLSARGRA